MDEVRKQIGRLSVSLIVESSALNKTAFQSKCSPSGESLNRVHRSDPEVLLVDEAKVDILDFEQASDLQKGHVIILSDDEKESEMCDDEKESDACADVCLSNSWYNKNTHQHNHTATDAAGVLKTDLKEKDFNTHGGVLESSEACPQLGSYSNDVHKKNLDKNKVQKSVSAVQAEPSKSNRKDIKTSDGVTDCFLKKSITSLVRISDGTVNSKQADAFAPEPYSSEKVSFDISMTSASEVQQTVNKALKTRDEVINEIVCDTDDDAWKFSFFKPPKGQQPLTTKLGASGPKRQVIQLSLPLQSRPGSVRLGGGLKRFQPPRLDDWYRPILELDFFVTVGLASETEKDHRSACKLKEIPVCFQSPDGYVEIFRPLVLEEFKAQLQNSYQDAVSSEEMCCGSLCVLSVERIDDFHVVRFVQDENESAGSKSLLENDLILLTRQPLQDSSSDVHAVGKVERREKDDKRRLKVLPIRLYLQGCPRLNRARKLLTERSRWYVSRIMSVTPQLREFQALSSIREIPLLQVILNPVNNHCDQYGSETENLSKLSQPLQQIFKSSYNASQLQAISLAIGPSDLKKDFELTLIQGPPGTGKTRTILAIVSGLLAFSEMKDSKKLIYSGSVHCNSSSTNRRISQSAAIARAWQDAALARQLNEDVDANNKSITSCSRGRILICAQSNAAVDELVSRISAEGIYGCDGQMYKPYLVRVGNAKTVHQNSLPFFIDTLVENRLGEEKQNAFDDRKSGSCADSLPMIRSNLEKLVDQIRYYESKQACLQGGNSEPKNLVEGYGGDVKALSDADLKAKLRQLHEKKKAAYADLAKIQVTEKKASEELRALRNKYRKVILKEAEIVVTTLSGCGGDLYGACSESTSSHKFINASENTVFDAVLIDEAAQALEPATLIPLQLLKSRGTKCIMVGDPKQLPATVLSNVASKYLLQCSMFERLQRAGHPVVMLTQQYRMHPEICRFPSSHFYEGKLLNGDKMLSRAASFHATWCLGPYVFFDITDGQELRGQHSASLSLYNESEVEAAVEVLRLFRKRYPAEFLGGRIGVITPYKRQLSLLRVRFSNAFGSSITSEMEFNTVDGFQGREVDILLLSTVRASGSCADTSRVSSSNIGFVADVRRMNVALTRAKLSLWIFGNARTLRTNQSWAALVQDATQRNLIVPGRKPYNFNIEIRSSTGKSSNIQFEEVERVNASGEHVNTQRNVKYASERKKKCVDTVLEDACTAREVSPSVKEDAMDEKKRSRNGKSISMVKEVVSVAISKSANKALEGEMLKSENQEKTDKSLTCMDIHEHKVLDTDIGKRKTIDIIGKHSTNSGKVKSRGSTNHSRPVAKELRSKIIMGDKPLDVKIGTSAERSSKGEPGGSSQVEALTDAIVKRKQQREAVDALLSSSLISSKKSESSGKSSLKRTLPTTNTSGHPARSQKRRSSKPSVS